MAVSDALAASDQTRGVSTQRGSGSTLGLFNGVKLTNADRNLDGHTASSLFGSVVIDLTADDLPTGETHMHVYSLFGSVEVFILNDVGVRITGLTMFSSAKVRGDEIGNGVFSTNEYISPGYGQATRRLHIDLTAIFSAMKLRR